MATRMLQRRGTAAEWAAANPILGDGEVGFVRDTNTIRIGDGVTAWSVLPEFTVSKAKDSELLDGLDSTAFLLVGGKAADSELLDGLDSTAFLRVGGKAADSELLDGLDSTAFMLATAKKTVRVPHTFTITGEVKLASGDTSYIPPFFIPVPAGQQATYVGHKRRINSGTSATCSLQKNGAAIAAVAATTTDTYSTTGAPTSFADGDVVALVITAVSATPRNLSFTVYFDYTV